MGRPAAATLCLLLTASVSACGTTTIDAGKAERFLRGAIAPRPRSVRCPGGVAVHAGRTFECDVVSARGVPYRVRLHIVDSSGRVSVSPGDVRAAG